MKLFAVVAQARSGTTMLGSALDRHPQILMHGEVFGGPTFPLNFYGIDENLPWPTPIELILKKARDADPIGFIDNYLLAETGRSVIGFKFKFEEFAVWPVVVEYLATSRVPLIFIRRARLVERYVSDVTAGLVGTFNSTDNVQIGNLHETDSMVVSPQEVRQAIDQSLGYYQLFERLFTLNPVLPIDYETMVSNWDEIFTQICRFLGVDALAIAPATEQRSAQLSEAVNLDREALRAAFEGTPYERYL